MANLLPLDSGPLAPVTEPIYHYTSSVGLLGALEGRRLWASQATSLNDHAEVRQGWSLIAQILEELQGEAPKDGIISTMFHWATSPMDQARHVCVLCASLRGDDANQWRLYGGASRGYAIELDPSVRLTAVVDGEPPKPKPAKPGQLFVDFDVFLVSGWLRAIYDPIVLKQAVRELWNQLLAATPPSPDPALSRDEQHAEYDEWWSGQQGVALSELATLAHLVKSEGFSGEHEVRTVVTHFGGPAYFRYRAGVNGIVGYREMARAPDGHSESKPYFAGKHGRPLQLPVRAVRVGPLALAGQEETVKDFLDTVDLAEVPVTRSKIPLR